MTRLFLLPVCALLALALPAQAQTFKPGLWESTSKMGGNPEMEKAMRAMQKQLADMPPAQRKKIEESMGQQGVSIGASDKGIVTKICVSKEMAERGDYPVQQQGDCKTTISDKTKTGMKMRFVCANPPSTGEGIYTFPNENSYTMAMKISGGAANAGPATTIDAAGKWLGSDCGNIKPMPLPKDVLGGK